MEWLKWDICCYFHGLNDFGYKPGTKEFSRSHTYDAECFAGGEGIKCTRNGYCVIARNQDWTKVSKKSW